MYKNIIASSVLHFGIILIATMSLPFITKRPIELPPIISVELIQIMDKTNIPFAPKAKKIIQEAKKKEEQNLVSEQAPPKKVKKEKPDALPLPDQKPEKISKIKIRRKILKTPRVGDHIWYISDTSKFKKHYPRWKQRYNTKKIIEELIEHQK